MQRFGFPLVRCQAWFILLALGCSTHFAEARLNVVTLPGRDSVQLTIYNSVDLTMVKETRILTFRRGVNRLEFSWANTLIDPTSVEFRALTHADAVEVLDVSFPPRVTNTLEWRIQSEYSGEVEVEIRYFTSGITWSGDYVAEVASDEKRMDLNGFVRVNNQSGEDYENAQIRLVVGIIRLVEEISRLAQGSIFEGKRDANTPERREAKNEMNKRFGEAIDSLAKSPREITKANFSEYFLYTVQGRDTIENGWSKRLLSFAGSGVPIKSYYKFEVERWGARVIRHYQFGNDPANQLGAAPLPDGEVRAFRVRSQDRLYSFQGSAPVKYIPVNEKAELELGDDPEIQVRPNLLNWQKTDLRFDQQGNVVGTTVKESWNLDIQNSKEIDVTVDIRRNFSGDW